MEHGFIKLWRKFLKWGWYEDVNTKAVFLHLLLTANYEDKEWRGIAVKRGQVVTGRKKLSEELGISEQNVRTSLTRLKSTNEITIKTTNKFSVITVINYDTYQSHEASTNQQTNQLSNQQLTNNQPTTNQQLTTTKEIKKKRSKEKHSLLNGRADELFEEAWLLYPRKLGKGAARKGFEKTVKTEEDYKLLLKAIENYKAEQVRIGTEERYYKHGSTFFTNWKDDEWHKLDSNQQPTREPTISQDKLEELFGKTGEQVDASLAF